MGEVIKLFDRADLWRDVFSHDGEGSSLRVYVNHGTGELEVVQFDDANQSIRTCITAADVIHLKEALGLVKPG